MAIVKYSATLSGNKLSGAIHVSDSFLKARNTLSELKADDVVREYLVEERGSCVTNQLLDLKTEIM